MKTKLTLLKNALLVGCAVFALTSCSDDDSLDYTTYDCAGLYEGSLTIREHGTARITTGSTVRRCRIPQHLWR